MFTKLDINNYEVFPRIVKAGVKSKIEVLPLSPKAKFDDNEKFMLTISPFEHSTETHILGPVNYDKIPAISKNGVLYFEYTFVEEQQWCVSIRNAEDESQKIDVFVYSANEDILERMPFTADFNIHTNNENGKQDPLLISADFRMAGFDAIAITDKNNINSSLEAREFYKKSNTELTFISGEEVLIYNNYISTISLFAKGSVNELYNSNKEKYDAEILEYSKTIKTPNGVNALEFAYRKFVCDKIHELGGLAVLTAPFRKISLKEGTGEYMIRRPMLDYLYDSKIYDIYEFVSGAGQSEGDLQRSYFLDKFIENEEYRPIIGSSNTLSSRPANQFNTAKTIVFAKSRKEEDLREAIMNGYVAVCQQIPGEMLHIYGQYRFVKLGHFYQSYYSYAHNNMCVEEGLQMKRFIAGEKDAVNKIKETNGRIENYTKAFLGRCK